MTEQVKARVEGAKYRGEELVHEAKGTAAKEAATNPDLPMGDRIRSAGECVSEAAKEKVAHAQADMANNRAKGHQLASQAQGAVEAAKHRGEELVHEAKGEAAKEQVKDSHLPMGDRIRAGGELIKEKAQEGVSHAQTEVDKQKAKGNI